MVRSAVPLLFLLASGIVGCADGAPGSDAGPGADVGPSADAAPEDASTPDASAADAGFRDLGPRPDTGIIGQGPCASLACLTSIDGLAAWDTLATPSTATTRCDLTEEVWFLVPKDGSAPVSQSIYASISAFPEALDLVRALLAPSTISVDDFLELAQREDTRSAYLGKLYRIDSNPERFGFHVLGTEYWGFAEQAEIEAVYTLLSASFSLPLVYLPQTNVAVQQASLFTGQAFEVLGPGCPEEAVCPDPEGSCLVVPAGVEACGKFAEGRSIAVEHARKIQLQLAEGTHVLPRATGSFELNLIRGGTYGPGRVPVTLDAPGVLNVTAFSGGLQYELEQRLSADSERIRLDFQLFVPDEDPRPFIFREPGLTESLGFFGNLVDSLEWDDVLVVGSCGHPSHPLYHAEGELEDGGRFRLGYRHALPFAGSGPLQLVSAGVELGGQLRRVTDYWNLTYAGAHHNWDNQFYVIFDVPIGYQNQGVFGLWIDEAAFSCCPLDAVHLLGPDLESLGTLPVRSYLRAPSFQ